MRDGPDILVDDCMKSSEEWLKSVDISSLKEQFEKNGYLVR